MKTGILFDLDGTLLDTLEDIRDSVNYALTTLGYPERTLEEVRRFVGNGARRLMEQAVPEGGDAEKAYAIFKSYYPTHCQIKTKPYAGIPEALGELAEKYPLAIVSNKPDSAALSICRGCMPGGRARIVPENPRRIWFSKPWKPSAQIAVSMWATARWMCLPPPTRTCPA